MMCDVSAIEVAQAKNVNVLHPVIRLTAKTQQQFNLLQLIIIYVFLWILLTFK